MPSVGWHKVSLIKPLIRLASFCRFPARRYNLPDCFRSKQDSFVNLYQIVHYQIAIFEAFFVYAFQMLDVGGVVERIGIGTKWKTVVTYDLREEHANSSRR